MQAKLDAAYGCPIAGVDVGGALEIPSLSDADARRFWSHVEKTEGCWVWTGTKKPAGYGKFSKGGKRDRRWYPAHRISWVLAGNSLNRSDAICHHCDNPSCVRPDHLFAGTLADNNRDMWSKGRGVLSHHVGEHHGNSKMSDARVVAARAVLLSGASLRRLAVELGVTATALSRAVRGKTYGHLPGPVRFVAGAWS